MVRTRQRHIEEGDAAAGAPAQAGAPAGGGGGRQSAAAGGSVRRSKRTRGTAPSQQQLALAAQREREGAAAAARRAAAEWRLHIEVERIEAEQRAAIEKAKAAAAAARAAAERQAAPKIRAAREVERRLLAEAAQARKRAAVAAELEGQPHSALLQLLLGERALPLVASFVPSAADKLSLALACKALLREFRQERQHWLRGLSLQLAPSDAAGLAACQRRVQGLLQLQPPAAGLSLEVVVRQWHLVPALLQLVGDLRDCLRSLDVHGEAGLWDPPFHQPSPALDGTFPQLTALRLALPQRDVRGRGGLRGWTAPPIADCCQAAPRLRCLQLSCCHVQQLPPGLTRLELHNVDLGPAAAASLVAATTLRALAMRAVVFVDLPDLAALSALTALTSLSISRVQHHWSVLELTAAASVVAAMPRLRELQLTSAPPNVLSRFAGQLTKLELVMGRLFPNPQLPALSSLARLTALRSLALVGPGLCDEYETYRDQLAHIPHLTLL